MQVVFLELLKQIPQTAGCYLFKNSKDQIIYVGKSKFLPKRVKSYFQKTDDVKVVKLVSEIKSEDLIKLYKPKFNIKGKDDKTIRSHLIITNEEWPKLELVFKHEESEGEVLAQFTSSNVAHEVYDLLHDIFQIRTCSYSINSKSIESKKFRPCIEHQIGRCLAPCVGLQSKLSNLTQFRLIRDIFSFNFTTTLKYFRKMMFYYSEKLEFEKANEIKNKIELVNKLKTTINPLKLRKTKLRIDEIKTKLGLKFTPSIIDAFDNSHQSGQDAVCGLVRFCNLSPDKSGYRKFIIKSGVGGDDIHSFEEVLVRRFKRLIEEGINLPNLIIIDGGKTQLGIAKKVIDDFGINEKLDLISISKDERHRPKTIHLTNGNELDVRDYTEFSKIIQEVHRFALDFHRVRRKNNFLK